MADIIDMNGNSIGEIGNTLGNEFGNKLEDKTNTNPFENPNKLIQLTNEQIEKIRQNLQNQNKNTMLTLKDCVDIVDRFIAGKCEVQELEDFGSKMVIRAYLPLLEKMSVLMKVLMRHEISNVETSEIKITELYKNIFFFIVMREYGQIQFNEFDEKDKQLMTYETYDKLFPLFNQYILTYCKDDYNMLIGMLKDCISLNGITQISDSLEGFDADNIQKAVENNKQLIEGLKESGELVEDLKEIMMANDKATKEIVKSIKEDALNEAKSEESSGSDEK